MALSPNGYPMEIDGKPCKQFNWDWLNQTRDFNRKYPDKAVHLMVAIITDEALEYLLNARPDLFADAQKQNAQLLRVAP